jgi:hypothetical protein
VFHVFQHLVQIRAQQDRHFPKMDLHHCNSIQSEQHNIRHDNRERIPLAAKVPKPHAHNAHRADSSKIRRVPQAAGALRYFPENALHEYHKEVSNNTAMYTSTSCSRSPAPCSQYHICTSTDQAPCAAAALLFSWPGCLLLFGRLKNAKKRQVWPTASNVREFKIAKFWDPAVCANILPNCEDVWVFSLNTRLVSRGLGSLAGLAGTNHGLGRLNVLQPGQKHSGIPKPGQRP